MILSSIMDLIICYLVLLSKYIYMNGVAAPSKLSQPSRIVAFSPLYSLSPHPGQRHTAAMQHAKPSLVPPPGHLKSLGPNSMQVLGENLSNQGLLLELSAIPISPPSTPTSAPLLRQHGEQLISTRTTLFQTCGSNSIMTPVWLTQILRAAAQDILPMS